jgi:hypothetical protein
MGRGSQGNRRSAPDRQAPQLRGGLSRSAPGELLLLFRRELDKHVLACSSFFSEDLRRQLLESPGITALQQLARGEQRVC